MENQLLTIIVQLDPYFTIQTLIRLRYVCLEFKNRICKNQTLWFFRLARDYRMKPERIQHFAKKYKLTNYDIYRKIKYGMMGCNLWGKLGLPSNHYGSSVPMQLTPTNVTQISCGREHTGMISHGKLYTCGKNNYGQLGIINYGGVYIGPMKTSLDEVSIVSCGSFHTVIVRDNKVYLFGGHICVSSNSREHHTQHVPQEIFSSDKIQMISCGNFYTIIVADDTLYLHGCVTKDGKIMQIEQFNNISGISCGENHLAVISNHKLYIMDTSSYYKFGTGYHQIAEPKFEEIKGLDNVTDVSCGNKFTLVVSDSRLFVFGKNDHYQLGLGHTNTIIEPIMIGEFGKINAIAAGCDTSLVAADDKLYITGSNNSGQLGIGHTHDTKIWTEIPGIENVISLSCGNDHMSIIYLDIKG